MNSAQYYTGLAALIRGNRYLDIYSAILAAKRGEDPKNYVEKLGEIKFLQGFATCWGHAKTIIDGGATPYLVDTLEYYYLNLLPGFVPFVPRANRVENQKVVEYLLERSNLYKRTSNPKFHSYDRVIHILCATEIVVTPENCKNFIGVGPKIAKHIKEFLGGSQSECHRRRPKVVYRPTQLRHFFKRPQQPTSLMYLKRYFS